jgi:tetratricopeptide (TPR) repeat protein
MHYSDDELWTFNKDRSQAAHQTAIETHLAECADCRVTLALFDELDEAFRKPEVWNQVPAFLARPTGLDGLLAAKAALERQNADALRRLGPHLKSPVNFENANVAYNARFYDAGVVRMLTAEAAALRDSKPKFALQLATAACFVARKLDSEPRDSQQLLLASALRERANALRYVGKFKDATTALDEAESILRELPDSVFDLAIIDYIRSTVAIQFEDRSGEALQLARSSLQTFRQYGDRERELAARLIEAESLGNLRGGSEAVDAYERVILLSQQLGRKEIGAHAYHNAATAYAELHNVDKAERYYAEALARYDELGNSVGKVTTEWELARVLVLRGRLEEGSKALDLARRNLLELGLREDHALATLDWAGARLALNRPEAVATACREIMLHYESEGATRNARLALAYVQEALRQGTASPRLIRQVRDYLAQLPRDPSAIFQPAT